MKKVLLIGIVFLVLINLVNAEQGVYNTDAGRCELASNIAFVTVCTEGNFDIINGIPTCVTQPKVDYLCPEKSHYDAIQNACLSDKDKIQCTKEGAVYNDEIGACIYEPELKGNCIKGKWDEDANVCILTENLDYLCLKGSLVDINGTKTCQIIPENDYICKKGFTYDNELGKCVKPYEESKFNILYVTIPLILIVLSLIIYLLSRKTRKR